MSAQSERDQSSVPTEAEGGVGPNGYRFTTHDIRRRDTEQGIRLTHGRHCRCSACAREDWSDPRLAACGMHGPSCPGVYAPIDAPLGSLVGPDGNVLPGVFHKDGPLAQIQHMADWVDEEATRACPNHETLRKAAINLRAAVEALR